MYLTPLDYFCWRLTLLKTITQKPVQESDKDDGYDGVLEWVRFDPPQNPTPEEEAAKRSAREAGSWAAWDNAYDWDNEPDWGTWDFAEDLGLGPVSSPGLQGPVLQEGIENDIENGTEGNIGTDFKDMTEKHIKTDTWEDVVMSFRRDNLKAVGRTSRRTMRQPTTRARLRLRTASSEGDCCVERSR